MPFLKKKTIIMQTLSTEIKFVIKLDYATIIMNMCITYMTFS